MANYNYDEAGNMAAYFLLSFLSLILIPLTISSSRSSASTFLAARLCFKTQIQARLRRTSKIKLSVPAVRTTTREHKET